MKTACGDDSHVISAVWHGLFSLLYIGALAFHVRSTLMHWRRRSLLVLAALLLAGCAAGPHTALLCFPVVVGGDRNALWCSPTDKVPSPPVGPARKPDEQT